MKPCDLEEYGSTHWQPWILNSGYTVQDIFGAENGNMWIMQSLQSQLASKPTKTWTIPAPWDQLHPKQFQHVESPARFDNKNRNILFPIPSMGLAYLYLHEWLICMVNVGKYTSFMDTSWVSCSSVSNNSKPPISNSATKQHCKQVLETSYLCYSMPVLCGMKPWQRNLHDNSPNCPLVNHRGNGSNCCFSIHFTYAMNNSSMRPSGQATTDLQGFGWVRMGGPWKLAWKLN